MVIFPIFRLPLQIPTKYSWAKLTCYSCRLAGRGGFLWAGWFTCVLLLLPFARWSSQGWRLGLLPGSFLFGFRILVFWVVILNMKLNYNCEHVYHTWLIHVHLPKTFFLKFLINVLSKYAYHHEKENLSRKYIAILREDDTCTSNNYSQNCRSSHPF